MAAVKRVAKGAEGLGLEGRLVWHIGIGVEVVWRSEAALRQGRHVVARGLLHEAEGEVLHGFKDAGVVGVVLHLRVERRVRLLHALHADTTLHVGGLV